MILLEINNRILEEAINSRLNNDRRDPVDITLADFDGVQFHVTSDADKKNILTVSLGWRCAQDMLRHGAADILKREFGPMYLPQPEAGYDVSLRLDLDAPTNTKDLGTRISFLKRHVFAAPFERVFGDLERGQAKPGVLALEYRDGEAIYIKPEGDRCIVIYSIAFRDPDDQVIAKVFLQEFQDARKSMTNVPSVTFSQKEPPLELQGVRGVRAGANNGFVSFVLFPAHLKNKAKTINNMQLFRDYLHYHIKCSKAYLHIRMRKRVDSLLQVLNRAKMEPFEVKEKKTITGRTFTRK